MGEATGENSLRISTIQHNESSEDMIATRDHAASEPDDVYQEQASSQIIPLLVSIFVTMFLVALDRTIISTAIPQITDEFSSLPDVGWYGSAYLLTCSSFQLLFGKFYTFWAVKTVLLLSVLLFEVGSIVCGAAPSSAAFIVGRAISGIGAAGVFNGAIVCIINAVPLQKRPRLLGLFGAIFGVASVVGPLVGGALTSKVTWRWCFYINAPVGGVAVVIIALYLKVPDQDNTKLPLIEKLSQLDVIGNIVLIPGVVCLLLALQWGGQTIIAGFLATIFTGSSQYVYIYFLPIWFQAIGGVSAVDSGTRLLPLMLATVLATILAGVAIQKIGYYTPIAIAGSCIMCVGAGLLMTLQIDTGKGKWIGYQILYGFGTGMCSQAPNIAAQTVLPTQDVSIGVALMFFGQLMGAAVFVSAGQNVLDTQLVQRFSNFPGFEPSLITSSGATSFLGSLPANLRETSLIEYNEALRKVFQIGLILSYLTALCIAMLEWKSVIKKPDADADNTHNTGDVGEKVVDADESAESDSGLVA
ncbi:hypothetical protein OCU04_002118 [Sclerotinia nivalis]|uniref:Major facilitator superfamily (MFS) profile domain-containing protein n=1 Tax=Sclerotinia nivalis TaxID=352851 RepID=A0A9X0AZG0_9HELO|nr:hypothetical protein OCU04_002118 [Sclerotinia nivalis]